MLTMICDTDGGHGDGSSARKGEAAALHRVEEPAGQAAQLRAQRERAHHRFLAYLQGMQMLHM